MAGENMDRGELVHALLTDVVGDEFVQQPGIKDTIKDILSEYNLSTGTSFVEKVASMKIGSGKKGEVIDISSMPQDLQDAAFLPVNCITDIALRQDLDLVVSQIPELHKALQIVRDSICEADVVTGRLARNITFDTIDESKSDGKSGNIMRKIEKVEEKLEVDSVIKNHIVYDSLFYGESYLYVIPYAKVFEDLWKYKTIGDGKGGLQSGVTNMFGTSSVLRGYGESAVVERSLYDTVVQESSSVESTKPLKRRKTSGVYTEAAVEETRHHIFTESEIKDINPEYHAEDEAKKRKNPEGDKECDDMLDYVAQNITYVGEDVALPIMEASAHDLYEVYKQKYAHKEPTYISEAMSVFKEAMESSPDSPESFDEKFGRVKGLYMKPLPSTKLIPCRIDRNIIGYYYASDMTKPEQAGERRNSGLTGYTLRSPAVGFDNFSPDQMFCDKLANKIINNFDIKFMRDNVALHQQIVSILQSHRFQQSMLRFMFIPAEYVIPFIINKDGAGKGHSMLEPGLVNARMYMFLKLYSLLYQINNSQIRVYNLRMSGIDKDYKQFIQEAMRKFAARRITANDIFNYRSSVTKVSGGSELILPLGPDDKPPVSIEKVDAADSPINTDLLDSSKEEVLNSTCVPGAMIKQAMSEIEFAKEVELSNTLLNSLIASVKIELNPAVTRFYRIMCRWETDIDPSLIDSLQYTFKCPSAKQLNVSNEMIGNFNNLADLAEKTFLTPKERGVKPGEDTTGVSGTARQFRKLLVSEMLGLDVDRFEQLATQAKQRANAEEIEEKSTNEENIVNSTEEEEMS